jgi:hypothetical protein
MNRLKSIFTAAIAVALVTALSVPSMTVIAQTPQEPGSASLSLTPKKNYLIEPGKSVKDKLTIKNLDRSATLNLTLRVVDFTFTDDGGTPKLFLAEDAPQTTWSLKPYLSVPKTVVVPKGGSQTVDMNVEMPKNIGAGSYYSAIIYSTGATDGGNVGLSASGVTLVFTQVPGQVNEDLKLEKFGAYRQATSKKPAGYEFFTLNEPQNIAYTLKNDGNVTEAPVGSISMRHMFGKETVINDVNPSQSLALIGQSRTYTTCIKAEEQKVELRESSTRSTTCVPPGLWPGYYSLSLSLYYGQNGNQTQEIVGSGSFWYMPWWFIVLLLVVIAVIAYFVWRLVQKIRGKMNPHYKRSNKTARRK